MTESAAGPVGRTAIAACAVEEVPEGGCTAVLDGRVLVTRVDGEIGAYVNRCLHQETPLDGGLVRDGVVVCPLHFWRYDIATGARVGLPDQRLPEVPCRVADGQVLVVPPAPEHEGSMRDLLHAHAQDWSRDAPSRDRSTGSGPRREDDCNGAT